MDKKERVNKILRIFNEYLDLGRLMGNAEAYENMVNLLVKSNLKASNPKLVLNTVCLGLDYICDTLEKSNRFIETESPTLARQFSILIQEITTLADNVRILSGQKKYEDAFTVLKKARRKVSRFLKRNEETITVFIEVSRKKLEDLYG